MKKDIIRAIIKKPGELPAVQWIDNTLGALQELVGGYIEAVTLGEDWTIICNEEGRLRGLPYNCEVCGVMFVGTIVFIGVDGDEFADFPIGLDEFREVFRELCEEVRA